jgi:hypothetical protein
MILLLYMSNQLYIHTPLQFVCQIMTSFICPVWTEGYPQSNRTQHDDPGPLILPGRKGTTRPYCWEQSKLAPQHTGMPTILFPAQTIPQRSNPTRTTASIQGRKHDTTKTEPRRAWSEKSKPTKRGHEGRTGVRTPRRASQAAAAFNSNVGVHPRSSLPLSTSTFSAPHFLHPRFSVPLPGGLLQSPPAHSSRQ